MSIAVGGELIRWCLKDSKRKPVPFIAVQAPLPPSQLESLSPCPIKPGRESLKR